MTARVRDPGQAALMSIPFPGLGHVWCGRLRRGLLAMALVHAAQVGGVAMLFARPSIWVPLVVLAAVAVAAIVVGLAVIDASRTAMTLPADHVPGDLQRPAVYLLFIATSLAVPLVCVAATGGRSPRTFRMASRSMEPAISENDLVLLNPAVYRRRAIERGDVVMYDSGEVGKLWVHRVIGLPGDTIEGDDGRVLLNGESLASAPEGMDDGRTRRERIGDRTWVVRPGFGFDAVTVPEGHVFLLGDQRHVSRDSRVLGCVPTSSIAGRVDYVLASLATNSWMTPMDGTR